MLPLSCSSAGFLPYPPPAEPHGVKAYLQGGFPRAMRTGYARSAMRKSTWYILLRIGVIRFPPGHRSAAATSTLRGEAAFEIAHTPGYSIPWGDRGTRPSAGLLLHSRLEAKAPAGTGEVDGGDRDPGSHVYSTRREQGLLPVDLHGEGAVRQAGGHPHWARALQAVGVGDLDDDGVVQAVGVGGEDGEAGDVGDLGQLGDRGGHPHVDMGGSPVRLIGDVGDDRVPGTCMLQSTRKKQRRCWVVHKCKDPGAGSRRKAVLYYRDSHSTE